MDNDKNMTIINNSGWDHTKPLNLQSKAALTQGLIVDEVIGKRERQIAALRRGLERLGIMDLLLQYPLQMEELFLHKAKWITHTRLRSCLSYTQPTSQAEQQALSWLFEYLQERDTSGPILL